MRRNAIAAGAMTAIWLLAGVVDQTFVRLPGHEFDLPVVVLAAFAVFAWVNKGLVLGRKSWERVLAIALAASALTAAWLPVTIYCVLQFRILTGGTL